MSDLAIVLKTSSGNPNIGDLELNSDGTEILLTDDPSQPTGRAVIQDLFIRLRFFFGEWFLDPTQGMPYFQSILVNDPDLSVIESIFRSVITSTPGVGGITSFTLDFDRSTRTLYPTFAGKLSDGTTFKSSDFTDFIVAV